MPGAEGGGEGRGAGTQKGFHSAGFGDVGFICGISHVKVLLLAFCM